MPTSPTDQGQLASALQFRPVPIWDPVPWWILQHLDKGKIVEIGRAQVELNRQVLESQLKATEAIAKILAR